MQEPELLRRDMRKQRVLIGIQLAIRFCQCMKWRYQETQR